MHHLPHYHWHVEIIPKLTKVAGFEWGTGFYINPTPPEELVTLLLMQFQVACGMEGDDLDALALAPDAQRDLLRHRAARHEDRRLFAEKSSDLVLEVANHGPRAVLIGKIIGASSLRELQLTRRAVAAAHASQGNARSAGK